MNYSLAQVFKLLRKNILTIFLCALIGSLGSFSISKFVIKPTYVSTVKLYVSINGASQSTTTNSLNDLNYAQKVVNTYIEMLQTDSFYKSVKEKSGTNLSVSDLRNVIKFSILNDTEVFQASVSASNPSDAKSMADVITMLAPDTINNIKENAKLKVVDNASFPEKPSSPNMVMNSVLGLLVGVIAAVLYVFLREALDVRIKDEDDLTERYNIPILGSIPDFDLQIGRGSSKNAKRGKAN